MLEINLDQVADLIKLENYLLKTKNIDLMFDVGILKEKLISEMELSNFDLLHAYDKAADITSIKFKKVLDACFKDDYLNLSFDQKQIIHSMQAKYDLKDLYGSKPIVSLVKLELIREKDFPIENIPLNSPTKIASFMKQVIGSPEVEYLYSVNLDSQFNPINVFMISKGNLRTSICDPRDVIKNALLSNAASFTLIHNHPSGDIRPSRSDFEITNKINAAAMICGLHLIDHIILADDQYYSFRENNNIDENYNYDPETNIEKIGM